MERESDFDAARHIEETKVCFSIEHVNRYKSSTEFEVIEKMKKQKTKKTLGNKRMLIKSKRKGRRRKIIVSPSESRLISKSIISLPCIHLSSIINVEKLSLRRFTLAPSCSGSKKVANTYNNTPASTTFRDTQEQQTKDNSTVQLCRRFNDQVAPRDRMLLAEKIIITRDTNDDDDDDDVHHSSYVKHTSPVPTQRITFTLLLLVLALSCQLKLLLNHAGGGGALATSNINSVWLAREPEVSALAPSTKFVSPGSTSSNQVTLSNSSSRQNTFIDQQQSHKSHIINNHQPASANTNTTNNNNNNNHSTNNTEMNTLVAAGTASRTIVFANQHTPPPFWTRPSTTKAAAASSNRSPNAAWKTTRLSSSAVTAVAAAAGGSHLQADSSSLQPSIVSLEQTSSSLNGGGGGEFSAQVINGNNNHQRRSDSFSSGGLLDSTGGVTGLPVDLDTPPSILLQPATPADYDGAANPQQQQQQQQNSQVQFDEDKQQQQQVPTANSNFNTILVSSGGGGGGDNSQTINLNNNNKTSTTSQQQQQQMLGGMVGLDQVGVAEYPNNSAGQSAGGSDGGGRFEQPATLYYLANNGADTGGWTGAAPSMSSDSSAALEPTAQPHLLLGGAGGGSEEHSRQQQQKPRRQLHNSGTQYGASEQEQQQQLSQQQQLQHQQLVSAIESAIRATAGSTAPAMPTPIGTEVEGDSAKSANLPPPPSSMSDGGGNFPLPDQSALGGGDAKLDSALGQGQIAAQPAAGLTNPHQGGVAILLDQDIGNQAAVGAINSANNNLNNNAYEIVGLQQQSPAQVEPPLLSSSGADSHQQAAHHTQHSPAPTSYLEFSNVLRSPNPLTQSNYNNANTPTFGQQHQASSTGFYQTTRTHNPLAHNIPMSGGGGGGQEQQNGHLLPPHQVSPQTSHNEQQAYYLMTPQQQQFNVYKNNPPPRPLVDFSVGGQQFSSQAKTTGRHPSPSSIAASEQRRRQTNRRSLLASLSNRLNNWVDSGAGANHSGVSDSAAANWRQQQSFLENSFYSSAGPTHSSAGRARRHPSITPMGGSSGGGSTRRRVVRLRPEVASDRLYYSTSPFGGADWAQPSYYPPHSTSHAHHQYRRPPRQPPLRNPYHHYYKAAAPLPPERFQNEYPHHYRHHPSFGNIQHPTVAPAISSLERFYNVGGGSRDHTNQFVAFGDSEAASTLGGIHRNKPHYYHHHHRRRPLHHRAPSMGTASNGYNNHMNNKKMSPPGSEPQPASFIPVVAVSVTKTSPAPKAATPSTHQSSNVYFNTDEQQTSGGGGAAGHSSSSSEAEIDEYLNSRVGGGSNKQQNRDYAVVNSGGGGSYQSRDSVPARQTIPGGGATDSSSGGGAHTTTVKSAVFGYVPSEQIDAAANPLLGAFGILGSQFATAGSSNTMGSQNHHSSSLSSGHHALASATRDTYAHPHGHSMGVALGGDNTNVNYEDNGYHQHPLVDTTRDNDGAHSSSRRLNSFHHHHNPLDHTSGDPGAGYSTGAGAMPLEEPPSLSLQLQANTFAQNDIAHPFFDENNSHSTAAGIRGVSGGASAHAMDHHQLHAHAHHQQQHPPAMAHAVGQHVVTPIEVYPANAFHSIQLLKPEHHQAAASIAQTLLNPLLAADSSYKNLHYITTTAAGGGGEHDSAEHNSAGGSARQQQQPLVPATILFHPGNSALHPQASAVLTQLSAPPLMHGIGGPVGGEQQQSNSNGGGDQQSSGSSISGVSIASAAGSQLNSKNKKRSSDFFANAGQILLSALPLLLAPTLGLMFVSSPATSAARLHGGFGSQTGGTIAGGSSGSSGAGVSQGSSSSSGSVMPSTYINSLSEGVVNKAANGPQFFTPTPPGYLLTTTTTTISNKPKKGSSSPSSGSSNHTHHHQGGATTPTPLSSSTNQRGKTGTNSSKSTTTMSPKVTITLTTLNPAPPYTNSNDSSNSGSALVGVSNKTNHRQLEHLAHSIVAGGDEMNTHSSSAGAGQQQHTIVLVTQESGGADNNNSSWSVMSDNGQSRRTQYDLAGGYEGVDFDAQYASLRRPTTGSSHHHRQPNKQPPMSNRTKENPPVATPPNQVTGHAVEHSAGGGGLSKHVDKNRYQYAAVTTGAALHIQPTASSSSAAAPVNLDPVPNRSHSATDSPWTELYPVSTWPPMRRRTVSLVTSNGNKTLLDSSDKYVQQLAQDSVLSSAGNFSTTTNSQRHAHPISVRVGPAQGLSYAAKLPAATLTSLSGGGFVSPVDESTKFDDEEEETNEDDTSYQPQRYNSSNNTNKSNSVATRKRLSRKGRPLSEETSLSMLPASLLSPQNITWSNHTDSLVDLKSRDDDIILSSSSSPHFSLNETTVLVNNNSSFSSSKVQEVKQRHERSIELDEEAQQQQLLSQEVNNNNSLGIPFITNYTTMAPSPSNASPSSSILEPSSSSSTTSQRPKRKKRIKKRIRVKKGGNHGATSTKSRQQNSNSTKPAAATFPSHHQQQHQQQAGGILEAHASNSNTNLYNRSASDSYAQDQLMGVVAAEPREDDKRGAWPTAPALTMTSQQQQNQEQLKEDASSKSKSAHIITTMITHLSDNNDEDNSDEENGGGGSTSVIVNGINAGKQSHRVRASLGGGRAKPHQQQQRDQFGGRGVVHTPTLQFNGSVMEDDEPTLSKSFPRHRLAASELREQQQQLELAATAAPGLEDPQAAFNAGGGSQLNLFSSGGRGRFPIGMGASGTPIEVTSTKIRLFNNGSHKISTSVQPDGEEVERDHIFFGNNNSTPSGRQHRPQKPAHTSGLVLTDDTKRALANFGSLLIKDSLSQVQEGAGATSRRDSPLAYNTNTDLSSNSLIETASTERSTSSSYADGAPQMIGTNGSDDFPPGSQVSDFFPDSRPPPSNRGGGGGGHSDYTESGNRRASANLGPGHAHHHNQHQQQQQHQRQLFHPQPQQHVQNFRTQSTGGGGGGSRGFGSTQNSFSDQNLADLANYYSSGGGDGGSFRAGNGIVRDQVNLIENEPSATGGFAGANTNYFEPNNSYYPTSSSSHAHEQGDRFLNNELNYSPRENYSSKHSPHLYSNNNNSNSFGYGTGGGGSKFNPTSSLNGYNLYTLDHINRTSQQAPASPEAAADHQQLTLNHSTTNPDFRYTPTSLSGINNNNQSLAAATGDRRRMVNSASSDYNSSESTGGGRHREAGPSSSGFLYDLMRNNNYNQPASSQQQALNRNSYSHHQQYDYHQHTQPSRGSSYSEEYPLSGSKNYNEDYRPPTHYGGGGGISSSSVDAAGSDPYYNTHKHDGSQQRGYGSSFGATTMSPHMNARYSPHSVSTPPSLSSELVTESGFEYQLPPANARIPSSNYAANSGSDPLYPPTKYSSTLRNHQHRGSGQQQQQHSTAATGGGRVNSANNLPESSSSNPFNIPESYTRTPHHQMGGAGGGNLMSSLSPGSHGSGSNETPVMNEYLKRVQFSDSDRDKLMASYLTCDGLLNDNDHCLERLSCEFSDPQNIEKANKLDRAVSSILLGHILINTYIPNQFKLRLKSASLFGYINSGKCSRYACNKLSKAAHQQQQHSASINS